MTPGLVSWNDHVARLFAKRRLGAVRILSALRWGAKYLGYHANGTVGVVDAEENTDDLRDALVRLERLGGAASIRLRSWEHRMVVLPADKGHDRVVDVMELSHDDPVEHMELYEDRDPPMQDIHWYTWPEPVDLDELAEDGEEE